MAKITINPITSSTNIETAINDRLQQIEDTFNNNVLWRDGFVAEPNSMAVDQDLGSNDILNVGTITADVFSSTNPLVLLQVSNAKEWADNAEDLLVSANAGGNLIDDYSALHHAAKSAASASAASVSEANAAVSETNAGVSATNALASEVAAAASYDAFDDRYLGEKASDPTLDNDGNALITGALYWNNVTDLMMVYNGTAWEDVGQDKVARGGDDMYGDLSVTHNTNPQMRVEGSTYPTVAIDSLYAGNGRAYVSRVNGNTGVFTLYPTSSDGITEVPSTALQLEADGVVTLGSDLIVGNGNIKLNWGALTSTEVNGNVSILPTGTGNAILGNFIFDADQVVGVGQDGYALVWNNTAAQIELQAINTDLINDLAPQLGGNLDVNDFDIIGKPATIGGNVDIIGGVASAGVGGDVNITSGAPSSGNVGGTINITAANNSGGATKAAGINLTAGSGGGPSGAGGDVTVVAGDGTGTGDAGGGFIVTTGDGSASGVGGPITMTAGTSTGGDGGAVTITAGASADNNVGGDITLVAGDSGPTGGDGGDINLVAGKTNDSGFDVAGNVNITAGQGGAGTFPATGQVFITGGAGGSGNSPGGSVTLAGGDGAATNGNGGDAILEAGAPAGTGNYGQVLLHVNSGGTVAAPGIAKTSDRDTGLLWDVANELAISAGATESARFKATEVSLGNFVFDIDQAVGVGQDNYVLTYDNALGTIQLEAGGGGGLSAVVDDLAPQLGGSLDGNGFDINMAGAEQIFLGAGSAANPALAFAADPDMGIYSTIAGNMYFSVGSAAKFDINANEVVLRVPARSSTAGSQSAPIYSYQADSDTGMYFPAADELGFTTGGVLRASATTTGFEFAEAAYFDAVVANGTAVAIDWTDGNHQTIAPTAATSPVYTFTTPGGPASLTLYATNLGAVTAVTWPATVKWPGGTEPTWTSSGTDVMKFEFDGTNYHLVASSLASA